MTSPIIVRVPGNAYPIRMEEGLLERAGTALEDLLAGRKIFILSDTTVWKLWGNKLRKSLQPQRPPVVLIPPGERYKRLSTVEKIANQLCDYGAERSSLLLVFGGGVVGDMGAFAASIFLRGIDHVQIPTTLLAQVDSAIGGKTGVNLAVGKNLLGTFCQPRMVLADPRVLRTLPERQLRAGLFEAIKCAVIGDPDLFEFLSRERNNILRGRPGALEVVIRACAALKGRVVSLDEKEGDLRRILNFGHTVGHALEAATYYRRFLHGEAVAWGMLAATRLAVQTGQLSRAEADRMDALVVSYGPVPSLQNISPTSVGKHLTVDKKVRDGKLHFILPQRVGEVKIVSGITPQEAVRILEELKKANPFQRPAGVLSVPPTRKP
ncbi:MAG: 3-dehydroquinate synthase [Acidobacteria bacterium RIFCSPLOWO2_12_FULL_59_11]|nr:MAG: 3-dehydroquinate synthase [Acidobacteria bacterium RIFCSPLOWO2_12_FULL_59_11]